MSAEFEPSPLEGLRRERIASCLVDSMPSAEEISRARARYHRSRARPRKLGTRALVVTLVQGMVLGLASAATAAFVVDRVRREPPPPAPAVTAPAVTPRVERAPARRVAPKTLQSTEPAAPPPTAPPPRARFEDPSGRTAPTGAPPARDALRAPAQPPRTAPGLARSKPQAPGSPASIEPSAAAAGVHSAALPPVPAPAGPWERVAQALEAGDFGGADSALNDLSASGDTHARDAAALARAQLWITRGRGSEARGTLLHLAKHGKTPLIRRRAAALLQGL